MDGSLEDIVDDLVRDGSIAEVLDLDNPHLSIIICPTSVLPQRAKAEEPTRVTGAIGGVARRAVCRSDKHHLELRAKTHTVSQLHSHDVDGVVIVVVLSTIAQLHRI